MQTQNELRAHKTSLKYSDDLQKIISFLLFYTEKETPKYLSMLKSANNVIKIHLQDVVLFDDTGLHERIKKNALTYLNLFYKAIDSVIFDSEEFLLEESIEPLLYHRIARLREKQPNKKVTEVIPTSLLRDYTIVLVPLDVVLSVRELNSGIIGQLVKVRGIVTRVSQIKPNCKVCTYVCESCGSETYQQVNNDVFDILEECPSEKCKIRNLKGTLHLQSRGSKFNKFQSLKLQELTSDTPKGNVPRSLNLECYNKMAECFRPGELIEVGGIFLPKPFYGFKKMKAGLLSDSYFLVLTPNLISDTKEVEEKINKSVILDSSIIAPEIYGLEDAKKIVLLMLIGSPTILKKDGMKIRGEINVLLLGDPGIAKSQLLKTAIKIARRSVYTTGKGTSGVGLTASVLKDPVSGEMILEGGALVLSDLGVCCIDELDKMNENDRVALHEVMEQQTISISKAGINTTLNCRTSILAAANPVKGRYNSKKSIEYNTGLPVALLSRFDVVIVLKDEKDEENDFKLANHITNYMKEDKVELSYEEIRKTIEEAKKIFPILPSEIKNILSESYISERQRNSRLTPRYLLSLIRLTMAHARLRFSDLCEEIDANEAIRLNKLTIHKTEKINPKHEIYNQIINFKGKVVDGNKIINFNEIKNVLLNKFKWQEIESCVNEFIKLGVWSLKDDEIVIFN